MMKAVIRFIAFLHYSVEKIFCAKVSPCPIHREKTLCVRLRVSRLACSPCFIFIDLFSALI
jgi:hypothetical protein